MEQKKRLWQKALIIAACCAVVFFAVLMPIFTAQVYDANFGRRFETPAWQMLNAEDFPGLRVQTCTFPSDKGYMLAGYKYERSTGKPPTGLIVMAHGLGSGHNTYMDIADFLAGSGYLVFAYDATGNDESEGDALGGMPQGVLDLDCALQYVSGVPEYVGLPIGLFGHSWGRLFGRRRARRASGGSGGCDRCRFRHFA